MVLLPILLVREPEAVDGQSLLLGGLRRSENLLVSPLGATDLLGMLAKRIGDDMLRAQIARNRQLVEQSHGLSQLIGGIRGAAWWGGLAHARRGSTYFRLWYWPW